MAAVDQAIAVLEGLAGKTLTNTQMINIVDNYIRYDPTSDFTNVQKAQAFIDKLYIKVREEVRTGAANKAHVAHNEVVLAAEIAALIDL